MKKMTYSILGTVLVLVAALLQRFDGGGLDLVLLLILGLGLIIASADQTPQRRASQKESPHGPY